MVMNRKGAVNGDGWVSVFFFIIGFVVLAIFLISWIATSSDSTDGFSKTMDAVAKIATPIGSAVFKAVVPAKITDEDMQYIAFGLFLLVWVVGTYSLATIQFFGPMSSFIIAGIIAMIGSRSLTSDLIVKSGLQAGPLTTMLFVMGVFPLLMAKGVMNRLFGKGNTFLDANRGGKRIQSAFMRMVLWVLLAVFYAVAVSLLIVANSNEAGKTAFTASLFSDSFSNSVSLFYFGATIIFGFFDSFSSMWADKQRRDAMRNVGAHMAATRTTIDQAAQVTVGEDAQAARDQASMRAAGL